MERKEILALALILLIGTSVRIYGLTKQSLWLDEANGIRIAEQGYGMILSELRDDVSPPLHYFLLHIWMKLFGSGEWSTRFFVALFGILLIPALYYIARSLFGSRVATLSAFVAAIARFHVRYSQEVRMYSMLALLGLFSFYLLYRAIKTDSKSAWFRYTLLTILTIYTHNYGLFIAISGITFFGIRYLLRGGDIRRFLVAQAAIAVAYLPWLPVLLFDQIPSSAIVGWIPRMRLYHVYETFKIYSGLDFEVFGSPVDGWIAGIGFVLFLCTFLAGLLPWKAYLRRRSPLRLSDEHLLPICYFFITLAIPMLISIKKPIYLTGRYSIAAWPAFPLIVGLGLSKVRKPALLVPALLAILVLASISLYWHHFVWVKSHDDRSIAQFLHSNAREHDLLVFAPSWSEIPINYYLRAPFPAIGYPWASRREPPEEVADETFPRPPLRVLERVKSKLQDTDGKVFFVYQTSATWVERIDELKRLFDENFTALKVTSFADVEITIYARPPAPNRE